MADDRLGALDDRSEQQLSVMSTSLQAALVTIGVVVVFQLNNPLHRPPGHRAGFDRVSGRSDRGQPDGRRVKAVPSATAALAIAAPLALAGLPGPSVLTLGISGPGFPQAGHSYTYLVSVDDPARSPAWLVHLAISVPAGARVIAPAGGGGAGRRDPR